jgi:hypothetical protein
MPLLRQMNLAVRFNARYETQDVCVALATIE